MDGHNSQVSWIGADDMHLQEGVSEQMGLSVHFYRPGVLLNKWQFC